jgi:hypothetical protein
MSSAIPRQEVRADRGAPLSRALEALAALAARVVGRREEEAATAWRIASTASITITITMRSLTARI